MRRWLCNWRTVLISVAALTLSSCASVGGKGWVELEPESADSGPTIHISGTVHHLDLEGGLFVIRDTKGTQYNPVNLPDAIRVEGMAVETVARRRGDMASIGMVGPLVELLRIRSRPGGDGSASTLVGTKWRLENLAGAGVVDRVQATLEFPAEGKVTGSGSCNTFRGTVTIGSGAITFGPRRRRECSVPRRSCTRRTSTSRHCMRPNASRSTGRFSTSSPRTDHSRYALSARENRGRARWTPPVHPNPLRCLFSLRRRC